MRNRFELGERVERFGCNTIGVEFGRGFRLGDGLLSPCAERPQKGGKAVTPANAEKRSAITADEIYKLLPNMMGILADGLPGAYAGCGSVSDRRPFGD